MAVLAVVVLGCLMPTVVRADSVGPTIDVWYGDTQSFGLIGTPQKWVNVLGNVSDEGGVSSLNFRLNGGPPSPLSIGPDSNRLISPGDFNVEIPITSMQQGANQILITATDGQNNVSTKTVTLDYSSANSWPMPYSVGWNSVTNIQNAVQVVDGLWTLEGNTIRPAIIGYDRILAVGQMTWTDYQVTVPMTIHGHQNGYGGSGCGIIIRWKGHTDWGGRQPTIGWNPIGASGWYDFGYKGGTLVLSGDNSGKLDEDTTGRHLEFDVPYVWKMRVLTLPSVGNEYKLKVWPASSPEPDNWDLAGIGGFNDLAEGSCLLIAHNADISFGDVAITPTADVDPPVISDIQAAPGTTSATITWTTDEPATGEVAFGPTPAYENGSVSHSSLRANHSLEITGLLAGTTYHYQVFSADGNGNRADSSDLEFTTETDTAAPVISNVQVTAGQTSATITWTTDEPARGSVSYGPTAAYEDGTIEDPALATQHTVTLIALTPNQMYHYRITSVDAYDNSAATEDATFTPTADVTPPAISNLQATPGITSATISWITNEPATSQVAFGPTSAYENGSVEQGTLVTSHIVVLTGLQPMTTYHYEVTSIDGSGNTASSSDALFTTNEQQNPGTITSDDFNATVLNPTLWTFVNPLDDATLTMNGFQAVIDVPGGVDHDIWANGAFAPRLMQAAQDTDFEVQARFESPLTQKYQMQGVFIEQDAQHFVRIEFHHNGLGIVLFAATFHNGRPNIRIVRAIPAGNPPEMRVRREGDDWTVSYSFDGAEWTSGGGFQFDLSVSAAGVFAANAEGDGGAVPAHMGVIDYVFNTASPIVPEDGDRCPEDAEKTDPGVCGCGMPDTDTDLDGTPDCNDQCPATVPGATVDAFGCPPRIPGDFDRDGDVDGDDATLFDACRSGANIQQIDPNCGPGKLDADDDVDQDDFGRFQLCLSGAGLPADSGCGN